MPKYIGNYVGFATGTDGTSGDMDGVFNLFDQVRIAETGNWPSPELLASGGTTTEPGNGYKYHFFTSSTQVFQITKNFGSVDVEYVLVGGGGAGGSSSGGGTGGGGGAGGFITGTFPNMAIGTYPVTVGSGGPSISNPGSETIFNSITAYAGGGGGPDFYPGSDGASGGGGGAIATGPQPTRTGGDGNQTQQGGPSIPAPLSPQGNPGGDGGGVPFDGGGGGGAGGAGEDSPGSSGGAGGVGKVAFNGDAGIPTDYGTPGPTPGRWFAGGGGGGGYPGAADAGLGGAGGGGTAYPDPGYSLDGASNTGGGGGGAVVGSFGAGGSGIVILRYLNPN